MDIAPTAAAAGAEHKGFARFGQVIDEFLEVLVDGSFKIFIVGWKAINCGARGNFNNFVLAAFARTLGAASTAAVFGMVMRAVAEVLQVVELGIDRNDDIPAFAAVPSIGAAFGDEFFPAETGTAVAAPARSGPHSDSIHKHSSQG